MRRSIFAMTALAALNFSCADLDKNINRAVKLAKTQVAPTQAESIDATKLAIKTGVEKGINLLGVQDGFLKSSYKVLIPAELNQTLSYAKKLGLESYVTKFEVSLNRAAEDAVKVATPIFTDAIKKMTIVDVVDILKGSDDAATQYFKRTSTAALVQAFSPIVRKATTKSDVGKYYNEIVRPVSPVARLAGVKIPDVDLDQYVTDKAIAALFDKIAIQEKLIRENPAERASQLLRKVFGYYEANKGKRG